MSLRERKKRLAQATIEEAALRLFQQQGYEQTSIQDIADAVMMSSRTFFRYFASKEEVLIGPMHAVQERRPPLSAARGVNGVSACSPASDPCAPWPACISSSGPVFCSAIRWSYRPHRLLLIYLYALVATEPVICDALCSHLESATNRNDDPFPGGHLHGRVACGS